MTQFVDAATTPVALIFAVPLAVSLVLWIVSIFGVFDFESDGGDGLLGDAFDGLGLAGVPPLVVFTMVTLAGWFLAVVAAMFLLDPLSGVGLILASVGVFAVAGLGGVFVGSRVARPLGQLMAVTLAPHDGELVGHIAVVRSGRVDATFGYADSDWDDGTTSRVNIRDPQRRGFTAGDQVRLMTWDEQNQAYEIAGERDLFDSTGDN